MSAENPAVPEGVPSSVPSPSNPLEKGESEELESEAQPRRMISEKPFISRRSTILHDSVQPRGVSGMTRIPPGNLISRRQFTTDENAPENPENPNAGAGANSHTYPNDYRTRTPRTDRQIQSGNVGGYSGQHRPYGGGYRQKPYRNYDSDWQDNREGREPREYQGGMRVHKEPLSLAEELAEEMSRRHKTPAQESDARFLAEISLKDESIGRLQRLSASELIAEARRYAITPVDPESERRHDLIFRILKEKIKLNGLMYGEGTLEILPDGFGFLRSVDFHYISCPDDIYVSPSQIRRFGLRTGTIISGQIRPPKENERYFALLRVEAINYRDPKEFSRKRHFEELVPVTPTRRMKLENDTSDVDTRLLDLMVPLGFGQRGLLVSPPGTGKTVLLQKIARAALRNYPNLYVFILLIDERPEEVSEMKQQVKGMNCEVIRSSFEEPTMRHIQIAEMVLDKAKRMVEYGQDVLILLDSITHFARAWNVETPVPGKVSTVAESTPGVSVNSGSLQAPRRFFSAARCIDRGGSLTILATAMTETENDADRVVYEEFRDSANFEIVLSKELAEKQIWPALDLKRSGTRREELLFTSDEYQKVAQLRQFLGEFDPANALEVLVNRLPRTKSNDEFLNGIVGRAER